MAGKVSAESDYDAAYAHAVAGRITESEALCREILATIPDHAETLHLLGVIAAKRGDGPTAIELFNRALASKPDFAKAHSNLGAVLLECGETEKAIDHIEKAIDLAPDLVDAYNNLGNALLKSRRLEDAAKAFERAIETEPSDPLAYNNLGSLLMSQGRVDEAITRFEKAIELNPGLALSHHNLGAVYRKLGEPERALKCFRKANFEQQPGGLESRFNLFQILFELGNKIEAVQHYEAWKSGNPQSKPDRNSAILILSSAKMNDSADYTIKPYIHEFREISLLTSHWLVFKEGQIFYEEVLNRNIERVPFVQALGRDGSIFADVPEASRVVEESCILLGGSTQYYHWMVDHLPRLSLVEQSGEMAALPLIVNEDFADFQTQSFEILGISPDRLVKLKSPDHIRCRRLLVPTNLSHGFGWLHADGVGWLRRAFRQETAVDDAQGGAFLYVSRRDSDRRKLLNEEALIEALAPLGFEVVVPGELSFRAQLDAFSAAKLIVGPHGAGLVNMIFAPDAVRVIELQHTNSPSRYISKFAESAGINLRTILGEPEKSDPFANPAELQMADFIVDVEAVVSEVRKSLGGIA